MNGEPAFLFSNVDFSYSPEKNILSSLTLTIPRNSITAILGPNGNGKTTFLHLALGWLKPTRGRVVLYGKDLSELSGPVRGKTISLLPQKEPFNFEYTIFEYTLLGRAPHLKHLEAPGEQDIRIVTDALCATGIGDMGARTLPTLSGGETQLVLLSRCLAQDPDVLLLDEPTNHLDLKNRRQMISLLREFREGGKTVVFTTHDPDLASALADHLILMGPNGSVRPGSFADLFTEKNLTVVYDVPVRIVQIEGHLKILW